MTALTLLAAALIFADSLTTWRVLAQGGREANPLAAWLITRAGIAVWTAVKAALAGVAVVVLWLSSYPWTPWVLAGLCAVYGAVVVHNLMQMQGVGDA